MKKLIIFILLIYSSNVYTQNVLYLDSCIDLAIKNYPIYRDKQLNKKIKELNIKNNKANYLPSLNFEGKATFQSDVFSFDIEMPNIPGFEFNFPEPPADQYDFSLNFSQLIYDGGTVKYLNLIEQKKLNIENKKNDIELYKLKEQVEKTYFSILILQKTEEQLILTIDELEQKMEKILSAVKNGILTSDNSDILQAEIYKLEQNLIEINENKKAGFQILQELMSTDLQENLKLDFSNNFEINNDSILRPEIDLFSMQNDILKTNIDLLQANRMPKIGAFAKVAFGNPGLTMVNDEWNPYFIVGAKITWNIWDKNKTKRNKEILKINSNLIQTKKESFTKNINILCKKELSEMSKLKKLIEKDKEIILLQKSICKTASSKLDNGIITSTDYLKLLNDKNRTIIKSKIHKIKLIESKRNYLRILGQ